MPNGYDHIPFITAGVELPNKNSERTFRGLPISSGKVVAPVCHYAASRHRVVVDRPLISDQEVKKELSRFEEALHVCSLDLDRITNEVAEKVGKVEAGIFTTQKQIMNDPMVVNRIRSRITDNRKNLEVAIDEIFSEFEEKFSHLDNEYLRERSTDIGEIRRRLLDHLHHTRPGFVCQGQEKCERGKDRIIVAEQLTADMMSRMKLESVLGIVTEHGGTTSHAAIIARSLGVPAISGVRGIYGSVACGTEILLDGDEGEVILEPDEKLISERIPAEPVDIGDSCMLTSPPGVSVMANASLIEDVEQARRVNADGIGLYRTEILFLRADRLLSEEEQFAHYSRVLQKMEGKPVVFRLLDIGGDKALPFLQIEKESNPFLGWRGARFLLGNPLVFNAQVRAIVRASNVGSVGILVPMVIDSNQMAQIVKAIRDQMAIVDHKPENIKIGAMFEVPSAFLDARGIYKLVDFASIGSNDLIQYLFAVDRNNELVSYDYNPEHPVLWNVLESLATTAREEGKQLSICGEMAGRHNAAPRLVEVGITSLSVSPRLVPRVRTEIANGPLTSAAMNA